jgi:hypothetical protein
MQKVIKKMIQTLIHNKLKIQIYRAIKITIINPNIMINLLAIKKKIHFFKNNKIL